MLGAHLFQQSSLKPNSPSKSKGDRMSFVQVDAFLKKLRTCLRTGYGLDLSVEDPLTHFL